MLRRVHVVVTGQVQAVGFRYYTYTMAAQLGVNGYVRNRYDGSVEIEAEAPEEQMTRFLSYVKHGPTYGRVDQMTVKELSDGKPFRRFNIY